jgi:acyl carrier protein
MSALAEARDLLAEAVGLPASAIADDAGFGQVERWDSIAHMRLMLALEEKVGREVTAEETMELFSLPEIARFLERAGPPVRQTP